jgi:hypothetical protein
VSLLDAPTRGAYIPAHTLHVRQASPGSSSADRFLGVPLVASTSRRVQASREVLRMKARFLGLAAAVVLLCAGTAQAQNNTAPNAAPVLVGQGWMNVNMDAGTNTQRWYRYGVVAGRSYCVEGASEDTPTQPLSGANDGMTSVFRADGTTLVGTGDEMGEPGGTGTTVLTPGRVCYVAPATEVNFAKLGNFNFLGTVKSYRWRIVETTLFCPWFFSGGGFDAFVLIRNTTGGAVNATVTLRSIAGAVLGTQTGTVPANGSYNLLVSAASPTGFGLASASGNVEIAFADSTPGGPNGSPGTLIANLTSLSFGQGVSFDTPFGPRADWTR